MSWDDFRPNRSFYLTERPEPRTKKDRSVILGQVVRRGIVLIPSLFYLFIVIQVLAMDPNKSLTTSDGSIKTKVSDHALISTDTEVQITAHCKCFFRLYTKDGTKKIDAVSSRAILEEDDDDFHIPEEEDWQINPDETWILESVGNRSVYFTFTSPSEEFDVNLLRPESEVETTRVIVLIFLSIINVLCTVLVLFLVFQ